MILEGEPAALVSSLRGRVWKKTVDRAALDELRASIAVLTTRLSAGRTEVVALADSAPDAGFTQVDPDLEDVYFSILGRAA